jgi:hypothetical protein
MLNFYTYNRPFGVKLYVIAYVFISEFLEIAEHYVEVICDYSLIFKESESSNKVFMDIINEVYDKSLSESHQVPMHVHKKLKLHTKGLH